MIIFRYKYAADELSHYQGMKLVSRDGVAWYHVDSEEGRAIRAEEDALAAKAAESLVCVKVDHEAGEITLERRPKEE